MGLNPGLLDNRRRLYPQFQLGGYSKSARILDLNVVENIDINGHVKGDLIQDIDDGGLVGFFYGLSIIVNLLNSECIFCFSDSYMVSSGHPDSATKNCSHTVVWF